MAGLDRRLGRAARLLLRMGTGLMLLILAVAVLAGLGTVIPHPFTQRIADDATPTRRILVIANNIHTDIAIPADAESAAFFAELGASGLPLQHPDARWLLFGWGGRSFYLETPTLADIKPGPLFRALTLDSSVMHVDVLGELLPNQPDITAIDLSEDAYAALLSAIAGSFARKDNQVQVVEGYSFGGIDRFFEAEGAFNALLGCNTWTASMLRGAGISTGFWNAIPPSLTASLHLFNPGKVR